ncbi:MAG TPA: DUF1275 family protein [Polyangiaceae bacterium]|nr:DUF1275 family protein [Polyangiaceae bacterium]
MRHESTGLSLGARDKLRAALLSGVAGYVDAAGLLSLAAMFPAHITGELVTESIALTAGQRAPGATHLWALPSFVVAVALAAVVARLERRAGRAPVPTLLMLVALGLLAFALSGAVSRAFPGLEPMLLGRIGACCAVAAMGFQNALMREALNGSAPTTFMTGNLTQLVIELVDHVFSWGRKPGIMGDVERSVSRARLRTAATALASFLAFAALGAVLTRSFGALSALLPASLVGVLSWQAFRERRAKAALVEVPQPAQGMRRPTPMQRPFGSQPRAESGTRFKAVRPVAESPKKADEETA